MGEEVDKKSYLSGKILVIDYNSLFNPPYKWGKLGLPIWVCQPIFVEMPYTTSPEESIAWLSTRMLDSRGYRLFKHIREQLKEYPRNEKLDNLIRSKKGLTRIARASARPALKNRTLTTHHSLSTENKPKDTQQMSFLKLAKSKEIINTPLTKRCQEMDDAATELLRQHGYFD